MASADSAKLYSLSFEHRPKYLYAYVQGEKDSYEISKAYWEEIALELAATGGEKLLVEDIDEAASMGDVFQLVSELSEMGFAGVRIAFYDRKIEHKDLNDFGEMVGTNRGLNGKVFNDIDDAEHWLVSGAP